MSFSVKYSDRSLATRFEVVAHLCGLAVIAFGIAALGAWAGDIIAISSVMPHGVAIQPNSALCFILAGISLSAAKRSRENRRWRIAQLVFAAPVALLGLITLAEYALNTQVGVDQLIMIAPPDSTSQNSTGRMEVATAIAFALMGMALCLLVVDVRQTISQGLALLVGGMATLSIAVYAYGVTALNGVAYYSSMSLHTAPVILVVSAGILLARPQQGILKVLISETVGGVLARRLLPFALGGPFLIEWLRIQGERAHLYESDFGVALTSVVYVILSSISILRTADALRQLDRLRLDAEDVKRRQQAEMLGLIDSAMDGIIMVNAHHTIITFNPAAERMFGYKAVEVIGCSLDRLIPQRYRRQHGGYIGAFDAGEACARQMGRPDSVTAVRADGMEFPIEASISKFESCEGMRYTAIVRDVTERKATQNALQESARRELVRAEELSKVLYAVPAAVCIAHDPLAEELTGNELYHKWFPSAKTVAPNLSDLLDNTISRKLDDAGNTHPVEDILRRAVQGQEIHNYEFSHARPDGVTLHVLGNALPLFDEHGAARGAISAFIDVTERKRAEQAMLSAMAATVAKSTYITHMTHELRTPLNTIVGYAQMLEMARRPPSDEQVRSIKQILNAGWYLRDLVNEVQSLAAIDAGTLSMSSKRLSVDKVLGDIRAMLEPLILKAGLNVMMPSTNGLHILANPIWIKQVLLNLFSNAIKYNRPGGRIAVECTMDGEGLVRISIEDTGNGLSPENLKQLFQPFNRLGQEHGPEVGTGVGLVITKKLVESMGGTIGVESEVGRGTVVWFSVPAVGEFIASANLA